MLINYTLADGSIINVNVTEEVGRAYLDSIKEEERINRKEIRRHISLNTFTYEDERFFSDGSNISEQIAVSVSIKAVLGKLTNRERFLVIKHYCDGCTYSEIAKAENKSHTTIMRETLKALSKFKQLYALYV